MLKDLKDRCGIVTSSLGGKSWVNVGTYSRKRFVRAEIAGGIVPVRSLLFSLLFFVYNSYNTLKYVKRCVVYSTRHIFVLFWVAVDEFGGTAV